MRRKIPDNAETGTLQQLSDVSLISDWKATDITATHPQIKYCEQQTLTLMEGIAPAAVPLFSEYYRETDDDLLALLQRRMTWGEFNRRDRTLAYKSKATELEARLDAETQARNAQAYNNMLTGLAAAALLQPRNPPTINCTTTQFGGMANTTCR